MKERPIIMQPESVRAILDGRKTMTRRAVVRLRGKGKISEFGPSDTPGYHWTFRDQNLRWHDVTHARLLDLCPYGVPGDRLWARETWADVNTAEGPAIAYRADGGARTWHEFSETFGPDYGAGRSMDYESYPGDYSMWIDDLLNREPDHRWKSPIHMPRWASRITVEVTDVRVERVQDISGQDALAEGVSIPRCGCEACATSSAMCPADASAAVLAYAELWDSINGPGAWERNDWVWVISFRRIA